MATKPSSSIAERLRNVDIAICNAMEDAVISKELASFGYNREKFEHGKALHDFAKVAFNAKISAESTQREAATAVKTAEIAAREAFQALAQVARAAFGRETLASLGLSSAMPHACTAFLTAGYALFDNALKIPDVLAKLSTYGYNAEKLSHEWEKISTYARAGHAQEAAKGAAQQATETQNKALKELRDWLSEFQKIAKVALRDNKQLLEKLGILGRTSMGHGSRQGPQPDNVLQPPAPAKPIMTGSQNTRVQNL